MRIINPAQGETLTAGARMDGASIDEWIKSSGFDWSIQSAPAQFTNAEGHTCIMPDRKVMYRSDTNAPLAVVSNRYKEVQPRAVFEFFRELVERNDMQLKVAGTLKGGRVLWALADNVGQSFTLGSNDTIQPSLLLRTSCDGSLSTSAYATTLRHLCNNTLAATRKDARAGVTVRHNTEFRADSVKKALGVDAQSIDAFASMADNLASSGVTDRQAVNYFAELYVKKDEKGNVTNESNLETVVNRIMGHYKTGPGSDSSTAKGTAWGLLNAVTYEQDHVATARNAENRFMSSQFGAGANIKENAVSLLTNGTMQFDELVQETSQARLGGQPAFNTLPA